MHVQIFRIILTFIPIFSPSTGVSLAHLFVLAIYCIASFFYTDIHLQWTSSGSRFSVSVFYVRRILFSVMFCVEPSSTLYAIASSGGILISTMAVAAFSAIYISTTMSNAEYIIGFQILPLSSVSPFAALNLVASLITLISLLIM